MSNYSTFLEEIAPWESTVKQGQFGFPRKGRDCQPQMKRVNKQKVNSLGSIPKYYFSRKKQQSFGTIPIERIENSIILPKLNQYTILAQSLSDDNSKIEQILPKQHYKSLYRRHFIASRKIIRVDQSNISPLRVQSQNTSLQKMKPPKDSSIVHEIRKKLAQKYKSKTRLGGYCPS